MHHFFIVNPTAGRIKVDLIVSCLKELLRDDFSHLSHTIALTDHVMHARKLSNKAAREHTNVRIYSVGGDGTINEIANGIKDSGNEKAILVPVPLGSGNDFVRSIGYVSEKNIRKLLTNAINSLCIELDICMVNERYFINISSIGFDAEVAVKANLYKANNKLVPKGLAYYIAVFTTFLKMKAYPVTITIDDEKVIERNITLIAVANGRFYGGGILPVPYASPTDGFIDVCIINKLNRAKVPFFFPLYIKGKHEKLKESEFIRCKNIKVSSKEIPLKINIDGEFSESHHVEFKICDSKILIGQI